jgi:hypothetical protein
VSADGPGERDERLGAALRRLDVPDHGPDFYPRLMARLEEEAARHPGSSRRPRWTGPYMLTAIAAAVVVVALATTTILRGDGGPPPDNGPELITASVVRSRVAGALASLETLRGEITIECAISVFSCSPPDEGGRTTEHWSFVTTAAGDERITGIGSAADTAYNSVTRTQREINEFRDGPRGQEITNISAGPPDGYRTSLLRREVGSVVRAFVTDTSDVPVTDTVEQGRPAWRLVTPVVVNKLAGPGGSGNQLEVIVDQQSGFPLRVTESLDGQFLQEIRLSNLVTDEPVDPSTFTFDFPPAMEVFHQDAGFQRVTVDQAAAIVGYRPVLPTDLPAGFEMTEITATAQGGGTGMEGMNPPAAGVVSVGYSRGFDRIVVSTRMSGDASACQPRSAVTCWGDPLSSGEGNTDVPEPFVVGRGALAGASAELVLSARGTPHVWSVDDRLVVTISGDASGDELRRMAESFSPR